MNHSSSKPFTFSSWQRPLLVLAIVVTPLATSLNQALAKPGPSWVSLNAAIAKNPKNPQAWMDRAEALAAALEDHKALQDYTKAILLNPNFVYAYFRRGLCQEHLGRKKESESDFNRAIELGSKSSDSDDQRVAIFARARLALRLEEEGSMAAAVEMRESIAKFTKEPKDLVRLGRCELNAGLLDKAYIDLNKGLKGCPDDGEGFGTLGECLAKQGKHADAIANYSKAITIISKTSQSFVVRKHYLLYEKRAKSYEQIGRKDLAARDRQLESECMNDAFEVAPFRDAPAAKVK